MISKENLKKLRQKGKHLDPIVRIGKSGLTESVMIQIEKALEKRELIKVKLLRSFTENHDRKKTGKEIAEKLKATIVEQVGLVLVLYKSKILERGRSITKRGRAPVRKVTERRRQAQ